MTDTTNNDNSREFWDAQREREGAAAKNVSLLNGAIVAACKELWPDIKIGYGLVLYGVPDNPDEPTFTFVTGNFEKIDVIKQLLIKGLEEISTDSPGTLKAEYVGTLDGNVAKKEG